MVAREGETGDTWIYINWKLLGRCIIVVVFFAALKIKYQQPTFIWLNQAALTLQSRRKDHTSSSTVMRIYMLSVIESTANKDWKLLPHILSQRRLRTITSIGRWKIGSRTKFTTIWIASKNSNFFVELIGRQANGNWKMFKDVFVECCYCFRWMRAAIITHWANTKRGVNTRAEGRRCARVNYRSRITLSSRCGGSDASYVLATRKINKRRAPRYTVVAWT